MKVVYLDVVNGNVMQMEIEDDLQVFYSMINCRCVEMPERRIGERADYFTLICDEEALLKSDPILSAYNDVREPMIFGNIIICKADYNTGELVSLTDEECAYVKSHIIPIKCVNNNTKESRMYFALSHCNY